MVSHTFYSQLSVTVVGSQSANLKNKKAFSLNIDKSDSFIGLVACCYNINYCIAVESANIYMEYVTLR